MKAKKIFIALLFSFTTIFAQSDFHRNLAVKIGAGHIRSNSPYVTSLTLGLAYTTHFGFLPVPIKFKYQLHKKIEYFFPGEFYEQTYPYLQSLSIDAVIFEQVSGNWFINFDLGIVLIHDRVFDNSDTFSQGTDVDISVGYHSENWAYYTGLNYGLGVTQHNPTYADFFFAIKYGL